MTASTQEQTAASLLRYVTGARWFAGKGRRAELGQVTALPWISESGAWPAVRFEVLEVSYPDESGTSERGHRPDQHATATELYQLAVSYRRSPEAALEHAEIGSYVDPELGEVVGYDAMQDPDACRTVLTRLLAARSYAGGGAETCFRLVSGDRLSADLEPRVYRGQQSNTSVMFGDVAMLKLFRRLEIGRNLDIEVHESLSRSGVADVARLYGWVEATWPGPTGEQLSADLAMVVEKLADADAEDGWALALEELRSGRDFSVRAADLGRALAEIHAALHAAFPSAEVSGADAAAVMKGRLTTAVGIAPALEPHVAGLDRCFAALGEATLVTQRVHGDFHLGQTLHTPTGWKIIDFEGEPVKSLAERSEPDSVWRDVAGMLRSFDYAAASVPGEGSREWVDACRAAFLDGYAGGPLGPGDTAVLRAYEADKAVYEVVYELRNRPDWIEIPLAAVATLADDGSDKPDLAAADAAAASTEAGAPTTEQAAPTTDRSASTTDTARAASSTAPATPARAKE